jgi:endonuclease YncB( thermonuclease family)
MAKWATNRHPRYGARNRGRITGRMLALAVLLAASVGFYVMKSRPTQPPSTVAGTSRVIDGDTIDISGTRIRLLAIDAPELEQACSDAQGQPWDCGAVAARELRTHLNGQDLKCESSRQDNFRRVLAICFMPDGSDINAWMVRQGWAVAFRTTKRYRPEQDEAAAAKRGLWAGAFTLPWEWRERNRRRASETGI